MTRYNRLARARRNLLSPRFGLRCLLEQLDARTLLSGTVFTSVVADLNGNGVRDAGENMLGGVTVYVDLNHNGALDAAEPNGVTNGDGEIRLNGVPNGAQVLRQIPPAGWAPAASSALSLNVTVLNNDTIEPFFYDTPTSGSSVDGIVWNDLDGDGAFTTADQGLSGWTVFIDSNKDGVLSAGEPSTISDTSGYYTLSDLAIGNYVVRVVLQPGFEPTLGFDAKHDVTVSVGTTSTIDFGVSSLNTGSITGSVWNDVNTNGVREPIEPGLDAWTVFLDTNANGTLDVGERSAVTDPLGVYTLNFVPQGTYAVAIEVQAGWTASNPAGGTRSVSVLAQQGTTSNYGVYTPTPGTISGAVWSDLNSDGLRGTEPGLNGWTVFIDANGNGTLDAGELNAVTNPDGSYTITGVPAGSWQVREVVQPGWAATAPGTATQLVTVGNGASVSGVLFGNFQRSDGGIGGVVFADLNHNGTRDAGEKGLDGITVFLDVNDNGTLDAGEASTTTSKDQFYTPAVNEAGSYAFSKLPAGTYKVRQVVPALLSSTPATEVVKSVTLAAGQLRSDANFADQYRPNEIHGIKYQDLNHNHVRDAGEPGIAGVVIYIDLNRNNKLDPSEPRTTTGADGTYSFVTNLQPGSYVLRELHPSGTTQTSPTTTGGILWPTGVSNPSSGNVTPTSITTSLVKDQTSTHNVSITLPGSGGITNMVDVFLLFDDTGSFTSNSPIVRAAFPTIISSLQAALPSVDMAFGVGRMEEYANFAAEYGTGRPFILNQPMIAQNVPGFATAIQSALDRTAPGYGGDQPETDIEALYQLVTGKGFDGNNNGTTTDSGAAGLVSTQVTPGNSGDVPSFASFTVDPSGNVLPASGNIGGAGFRPGALPIVLLATDTGFAYQPKGESTITGVGGVTLPVTQLTQTSRPSTPFNSGAGIQETITALNALGALVIGLGTNGQTNIDPRQQLSAISKLTGAVNRSTATIPNGTTVPIAPGDPYYFQIASGFGASVANGVVSAISNAVINSAMNISLHATDSKIGMSSNPTVVNNVGPGQTATFDVTFTGDGRPHRFDLQFVRQGTDVVLGSTPVVIGTPITGDGYEFDDLDDGEIEIDDEFGASIDATDPANVAPSFTKGADESVRNEDGPQTRTGWAKNISAGPASEVDQLLSFIVTTDHPELFSSQPVIDEAGTLSYTPAVGAVGAATVSVQIHDSGLTFNGGVDTSAAQTFVISVSTLSPLSVTPAFVYLTSQALILDFSQDVGSTLALTDLVVTNRATLATVPLNALSYDAATRRATISFGPGGLPSGNYRLSIGVGSVANLASAVTFDFHFLTADSNGDGVVNFDDLLALAANYNTSGKTFAQGDFNYDGVVNFDDLLLLAANYNTTLPVPAPGFSAVGAAPPASSEPGSGAVAADVLS
jgi:hypothetical protein